MVDLIYIAIVLGVVALLIALIVALVGFVCGVGLVPMCLLSLSLLL